jgi:hypothetical protein
MKIKLTSNIEHRTPNAQCRARPFHSKLEVECSLLNVSDSPYFRPSPFALQPSRQRGFALVITLILLSVTLIMAVAFLAISRRERGSVVTSTDTATARYAADAALANAEAQIMSSALATTNPYINNLLVSTNFINTAGFSRLAGANPTNVNYDFRLNGAALSVNDFLQNVANLQLLPRAPVYVPTNNLGSSEFRFYLDLNRDGKFEDSGMVTNLDNTGAGLGTTSFEMGDPQWIGVLERPDAPHGPNNKFLARYAFIALPAGSTLDLNAIHNEAISQTVNPAANGQDGYFRNQGVGSWEINLAAFLTDLNPNEWDTVASPYNYQETLPTPFANTGFAFQDALSLLSYRYNFNYNFLAPVGGTGGAVPPGLFTASTFFSPFQNNIDYYSRGGLMTTLRGTNFFPTITVSWAGADNTNHYFALMSDLFDPNKVEYQVTPPGFIERLNQASTNISTFDRYTFYRLLSQLGTDSSPESGKMNLNYDNLDRGITPRTRAFTGPVSLTNFMVWTPLAFFTNAADRMLRLYSTNWFQANPPNYLFTYFGFTNIAGYYTNNPGQYFYINGSGITINYDRNGFGLTNVPLFGMTNQIPALSLTNIPAYVNGRYVYSSAVHRALQLAANIYDASTNSFYPSVFRPLFRKDQFGNIFVIGYTNLNSGNIPNTVSSQNDIQLSVPFDAVTIAALSPGQNIIVSPMDNIYGVPWIIGAKKNLPNFNEFSMQDVVQCTRLLQVTRPNTNSLPTATNQMYLFSVTNSLGVEFWNSYTNGYSNQVQVVVNDYLNMQMVLSNGPTILTFPFGWANPSIFGLNTFTNVTTIWPGRSFVLPLNTNVSYLPNSQYDFFNKQFDYVGNNPNPSFQSITPNSFANLPQMLLQVTNRLQAFMLDGTGTHVIDYVSFAGPQSTRNLNSEIFNTNTAVLSLDSQYTNLVWSTALDNSTSTGNPLGIDTQMGISDGSIGYDQTYWKSPPQQVGTPQAEIDGFRHFLNPRYASLYSTPSAYLPYTTNLAVQAPYAPTVATYEYTSWQANDPLVHYMQSDLYFTGSDPQNGSSTIQTGVHQAPVTLSAPLPLLPDLGRVNARYQPWGATTPTVGTGISQQNYDENAFNLAFKDPLMSQSDNWNFPTNKYPTVGWLGRVHRGTPWQTVYLKAHNILAEINPVNPAYGNVGTNTWAIWTGNTANPVDAANSAPVQDRLLFDLFTTAINDNATRGQLSVNVAANPADPAAGLAAWSALFSGMVALTNTTTFPLGSPLTYLPVTIQPAGPAGMNSTLGKLVQGINDTRTNFVNPDGVKGAFEHIGDIMSVLQLTEASPFLNTNSIILNGKVINGSQQLLYGISDEMYEWLPQQTLSMLSCSTAPRYVIYCYGQALKPAPNGMVTSGTILPGGLNPFGMVTNYQVVAETATRAVVQFQPVVVTNSVTGLIQTNYSATIEQFNPLPPD